MDLFKNQHIVHFNCDVFNSPQRPSKTTVCIRDGTFDCPEMEMNCIEFTDNISICCTYCKIDLAMLGVMVWAGILGRPDDLVGGNWVWLNEGKPGVNGSPEPKCT